MYLTNTESIVILISFISIIISIISLINSNKKNAIEILLFLSEKESEYADNLTKKENKLDNIDKYLNHLELISLIYLESNIIDVKIKKLIKTYFFEIFKNISKKYTSEIFDNRYYYEKIKLVFRKWQIKKPK